MQCRSAGWRLGRSGPLDRCEQRRAEVHGKGGELPARVLFLSDRLIDGLFFLKRPTCCNDLGQMGHVVVVSGGIKDRLPLFWG